MNALPAVKRYWRIPEGCTEWFVRGTDYDAQSDEVRRLREALTSLLHTPAVIDAMNPSREPHLDKCECAFCVGNALIRGSQP